MFVKISTSILLSLFIICAIFIVILSFPCGTDIIPIDTCYLIGDEVYFSFNGEVCSVSFSSVKIGTQYPCYVKQSTNICGDYVFWVTLYLSEESFTELSLNFEVSND